MEYDHEAFLGEKEASHFNDLSPEESKKRLGKIVNKIDSDKVILWSDKLFIAHIKIYRLTI